MPFCLDVARKLGIKGAPFFTQACAVSALYYHYNEGNLKIGNHLGTTSFSMPAMPVMEIGDLPSLIQDRDLYPVFLSQMVNQFSNFQKADWLLVNTFDKLEEEVLNWMASRWPKIKTIGPTIPSVYLDKQLEDDKYYGLSLFHPSTEACMKWLDTKEKSSVVYASFGSMATVGGSQMEELAMGLKNSNENFLWVVRASEESKLPSNIVAETSEKGLFSVLFTLYFVYGNANTTFIFLVARFCLNVSGKPGLARGLELLQPTLHSFRIIVRIF
ncbi:hypothetical protein RHSIM_Rhsim04G0101700 [Rhododendron simsii]|uniref:Uncharacterized protein n=1 Tax=Rhododendron simsii TaxID=118357 RepID=A0A834H639_RHOSS|nr:hypothetical protein RHSIM_Rhsim04G0101700 [Rhododendron simsii]